MQRSEPFLRAVRDLKKALPALRKRLAEQFEAQSHESAVFRAAFESCFETLTSLFREEYRRGDQFGIFERLGDLEPDFTREQFSTFLIQHFLLEPLLNWMFPDALVQNQITQSVERVMHVFENRAWLRLSVDGHFPLIERELRACTSNAERQHVLNTVCEFFLNGFDPQRAEELGVIYTPPEVVDFMCASCEKHVLQAYGRQLSSANIPILDPCTGTGSFLVNIIGRIDPVTLPYKYTNELFGIEIMVLPYYIATLNVEQAFFERIGHYQPFPGMRYADALLT